MWIPADKGKCQGPEVCRSASQEAPAGGACSRRRGAQKGQEATCSGRAAKSRISGQSKAGIFITKGLPLFLGRDVSGLSMCLVPDTARGTLGNHVKPPHTWAAPSKEEGEKSAKSQAGFYRNPCDHSFPSLCVDGVGVGDPGTRAHRVCVCMRPCALKRLCGVSS